tara:strand:- start:43 stop:300 length:258 start_codon:yes stop_codon:yes gene_type:complete
MKMTVDMREFLYCPSCNKMYSSPFFMDKSGMRQQQLNWLSQSWDRMFDGKKCMTKNCYRSEGFITLVLTPDKGLTEAPKSTDEVE